MECGSLVESLLNVKKALGSEARPWAVRQELSVMPGFNKPDLSIISLTRCLFM